MVGGIMEFRYGDINNDEDFDRLVNACRIVKRKCRADWEVMDIIDGIHKKSLEFVINGNDIGVFYVKNEYFTNNPQFWIWIAYAEGGNAFERYLDSFELLAKHRNCLSIGWDSNRVGYLRSLKRLKNTKIDRIEYRLPLYTPT